MAFGALRKAYSAKCNFFADDSSFTNKIHWYIVPDHTPVYTEPTVFFPRVDDHDGTGPSPFEQTGPGRFVRRFNDGFDRFGCGKSKVNGDEGDFLGQSNQDKYAIGPLVMKAPGFFKEKPIELVPDDDDCFTSTRSTIHHHDFHPNEDYAVWARIQTSGRSFDFQLDMLHLSTVTVVSILEVYKGPDPDHLSLIASFPLLPAWGFHQEIYLPGGEWMYLRCLPFAGNGPFRVAVSGRPPLLGPCVCVPRVRSKLGLGFKVGSWTPIPPPPKFGLALGMSVGEFTPAIAHFGLALGMVVPLEVGGGEGGGPGGP